MSKRSRSLFSPTERKNETAEALTKVIPLAAAANSGEAGTLLHKEPKAPGLNITQLRETFDAQAPNRVNWREDDYTELLRRLDRIQTEAFILKGKLLSEVKEKFFAANKTGWVDFCENKLAMNYTTANQYIRVALEFDVTSHHYPTLGFEHFKALLPVEPAVRENLLLNFQGGSVKALRILVTEKYQRIEGARAKPDSGRSSKAAGQLLKTLQHVQEILARIEMADLGKQKQWQLANACKQLGAELLRVGSLAQGIDFGDHGEDSSEGVFL